MTKAELVEAVAKAVDLSKAKAQEAIDATFDEVAKAIKKDKKFLVPGFGSFAVTKRKARKGRNPKTGEEIKIKASKSVRFKPAAKLKEAV
jgi:DNA-binding protein HU-beta